MSTSYHYLVAPDDEDDLETQSKAADNEESAMSPDRGTRLCEVSCRSIRRQEKLHAAFEYAAPSGGPDGRRTQLANIIFPPHIQRHAALIDKIVLEDKNYKIVMGNGGEGDASAEIRKRNRTKTPEHDNDSQALETAQPTQQADSESGESIYKMRSRHSSSR